MLFKSYLKSSKKHISFCVNKSQNHTNRFGKASHFVLAIVTSHSTLWSIYKKSHFSPHRLKMAHFTKKEIFKGYLRFLIIIFQQFFSLQQFFWVLQLYVPVSSQQIQPFPVLPEVFSLHQRAVPVLSPDYGWW